MSISASYGFSIFHEPLINWVNEEDKLLKKYHGNMKKMLTYPKDDTIINTY